MGSYITRNRAWVYVAFYDEYVGRHINTSIGSSIIDMSTNVFIIEGNINPIEKMIN